MVERTNEDWLADLNSDGTRRDDALEDLRARLERGVFFYLRNDRSDLSSRSTDEIEQLTQDFVQDAQLKILDNLETFRGESKFTTWASKIATRVAISELRRVRYKNYSLDHLTADGETMPSIAMLAVTPDEALAPESYTEREEVFRIVNNAIENALTERQRTALTAYVIDGVNIETIADKMNTNRNALYKLIHDARYKLKKYMEEQGLSLDYILDLFE